jgi:hypothetical protein
MSTSEYPVRPPYRAVYTLFVLAKHPRNCILTRRKSLHGRQGRIESLARQRTYFHFLPLHGPSPLYHRIGSIIRCERLASEILCFSLRRNVSQPPFRRGRA